MTLELTASATLTADVGVLALIQVHAPSWAWTELGQMATEPGLVRLLVRHVPRCRGCAAEGVCRKARGWLRRFGLRGRGPIRPYEPVVARALFGRRRRGRILA